MRLAKEIKASVKEGKEEVEFTLSRPSNEELNQFLAERVQADGGRIKDLSYEARCSFFDRLLVHVNGLEDENDNAITVDRKELIPANWKAGVIFRLFEETAISIKN